MHAASMHYDVKGVARLEISRLETSNGWSKVKTTVFGGLMAVSPRRLVEAVASHLSNAFVQLIKRDTLKVQSFTLQFKNIKVGLAQEIAESGEIPGPFIVAALSKLQTTLQAQQISLDKVSTQLQEIKKDTRVYQEVRKQMAALVELSDAVHQLHLVAIGAGAIAEMSWAESVQASHQNFLAVTKSLAAADEELDPELLALAEEAVAAAENRKSMEPSWASNLARSPYH
ncbi:hypothetical protein [Rhodoferax sp. GW822-FHT02A01]|uniref:hypothetical protein n=1 Tax=Rhodoferax sp. GW822-FHT02A01 TaxID=3141537 RepID=UPI00315D79AF